MERGVSTEEKRFVVAYGKTRGAVFVKDTVTSDVLGVWFGADALLNATEQAALLNAQRGAA